jgi:hypothetical protein
MANLKDGSTGRKGLPREEACGRGSRKAAKRGPGERWIPQKPTEDKMLSMLTEAGAPMSQSNVLGVPRRLLYGLSTASRGMGCNVESAPVNREKKLPQQTGSRGFSVCLSMAGDDIRRCLHLEDGFRQEGADPAISYVNDGMAPQIRKDCVSCCACRTLT